MNSRPADKPISVPEPSFLAGGGEMGERIRSFDWSVTPLGPAADWPQSLKTTVRIMLASRQPVWIGWGPQLTYLYNDPYQDIIGGRHPVALGRATREVWPEIWDVIGPMLETAMAGVEGTYVEEQLLIMERHGYREETYYTFSYTPVPDDSGNPGGIICVNTDDTQRVLGERRMAALRALASGVADAQDANEACQKAAKELGGSSYDVPFALIYLVEGGAAEARLAAAVGVQPGGAAAPERVGLEEGPDELSPWPLRDTLAGGKRTVAGIDPRMQLPGGPWPEHTHTALVLPLSAGSGGGQPLGFLVVGVSPRRALDDRYEGFFDLLAASVAQGIANARALDEERRRREALAELDRAKTAFFSNVSHEFRTPLTLMLAPLEDLLSRRDADLTPAAASTLEIVNRNGRRLLRLVNTLLDFSRIEAGRVQAFYEPVDLAMLTAELASVFRSACQRAGLQLTVECPPLPEPVYVDRDMWEKVVLNLISNAFKFTFEGEIAVSVASVDGHAELRVRDSGVGIPAEEVPRLFERFHRIESTRSRTHEGSGIGLALVQELVRLHSGSVRAESSLGEGTTFIVTLPIGTAHLPPNRIGARHSTSPTALGAAPFVEEALRWLPDDAPVAAPETASAPQSLAVSRPESGRGGNRPRVLVADDNADMRQYLTRLLADRYEVESVPNGEAALSSVRVRRPDLVLSDVMMPLLDGIGLVHQLRANDVTRTLPIVLLSARAGEESRVEGIAAGADDYLVKPFSARELLARVESHIQLARVREEAEERVTQILESITDGFHALDANGRFTQFNAAARELFAARGVDVDGLLGMHLFEAFPDARETAAGNSILRTLAEHVPTAVENFFPPWQRWFALRNFPMTDGGVASFFQDITERKQAEEIARVSHETFRHLVESSPFGVYVIDVDFRLVQVSAGAQKVFENVHPLLGRDFAEILRSIWPEQFASEAIARFRHTLETGEPYHSPRTVEQRRDLDEIESYDWRIERVPLPDSRHGVVCYFYDLSERQEYEAALRESEERFRALVTTASELVYRMSADWSEMRHLDGKNFIADTHSSDPAWMDRYVPPEDHQAMRRVVDEAIRTRTTFVHEHRVIRVDGSLGWVFSRAVPLLDGKGEISEWFGAASDVTERKRAEEALRAAKEQAEAANRAKDAFLAALSHELRTPLTPVLMSAASLRDDERLPAEVREQLSMMERNITLEARLIDDLLDLTRIAKGKLTIRPQSCDAHSLISLAVEIVRDEARAKELTLERDFRAENYGLTADATRFQQVIWNLLRNAVRFTPPGGRIRIETRDIIENGECRLCIEVSDNGIGIEPDALDRIFAPFEQASLKGEHRFGGLGLGLAIARAIVELHGGSIRAESAGLGTGATFTVELPGATEPVAGVAPLGEEHGAAMAADGASVRLLLVEDHEPTLRVLSRLLKRAGHDVITASSLAEAFAAAEDGVFDLVISDVGLPDGTGIELMSTLRERHGLTGIALSGYGMEDDMVRTRAAGFVAHLIKPVDFDQLRRALREVLVR